jgi:hypothetical protein
MVKYTCKNCNHKSEGDSLSKCGFCGMESIEKDNDAEELLSEIADLLG